MPFEFTKQHSNKIMIPVAPPQSYTTSRYGTMPHSLRNLPQPFRPGAAGMAFQRRQPHIRLPPRKRIRYTSTDELCAASVLISLTPRDVIPQDDTIIPRNVVVPTTSMNNLQQQLQQQYQPFQTQGVVYAHHHPRRQVLCPLPSSPSRPHQQQRQLQLLQQHFLPPSLLMEESKRMMIARGGAEPSPRSLHCKLSSSPPRPVPTSVNASVVRNVVSSSSISDSSSSSSPRCFSPENAAKVSPTQSFDSNASLNSPDKSGSNVQPAWFEGHTSLALPEDDDVLSPLHCFMRRYCVEAFSASERDVATPRYGKSHGIKVVVKQVGIRCLYCKHLPAGQRPERAVCYPSSLQNIYHSIETWQRRHSLVCSHIPSWVRKSILELMESSKSRAGGRRKYWEDSAKRLGMVDTSHGVRFSRLPGYLGPEDSQCGTNSDGSVGSMTSAPPSRPVVGEEDRELVTPHLFLLLEQMQTCHFTEEDRTGGRSKIKNNDIGFPGMQCKHCMGKAGFGRYFPTSANALALANSDRNIYNHIKKCRRCPMSVKSELHRLSQEVSQSKNRRGLRKMFFNRVWGRIHHHGDDDDDENNQEEAESTAV